MTHDSLQYENQVELTGPFFERLAPAALRELASLISPASYPPSHTIFSEKDPARGIYFVLQGDVKLSINSSEGRRLSLRIARKGEMLGLSAVVSGSPHEMTAETVYPSHLAFVGRREFLALLARHPEAYQPLSEELTREFALACGQLRTVGLASSAPEKLARLLLDWSENGQTVEAGVRFRFSLTHEEIGEFIGASRETVTRTLGIFKSRHLVAFHGSTVTIPSRTALADVAGG